MLNKKKYLKYHIFLSKINLTFNLKVFVGKILVG